MFLSNIGPMYPDWKYQANVSSKKKRKKLKGKGRILCNQSHSNICDNKVYLGSPKASTSFMHSLSTVLIWFSIDWSSRPNEDSITDLLISLTLTELHYLLITPSVRNTVLQRTALNHSSVSFIPLSIFPWHTMPNLDLIYYMPFH